MLTGAQAKKASTPFSLSFSDSRATRLDSATIGAVWRSLLGVRLVGCGDNWTILWSGMACSLAAPQRHLLGSLVRVVTTANFHSRR